MHHLQTKILYNLALHDALRFSQLKPKELESNQFMYHLKTVMAQGLVEKDGPLYRLSTKGLRYVNGLSFELLSTRLQPVAKTMIYAKSEAGKQLLYRFNRQPLRGRIGFVNGKIHYGETIEDAAKRELLEKSGLESDLSYAGQINSRRYEGDELITHTFNFIFRAGGKMRGQLNTESGIHGVSFWGRLDDFGPDELMPGLPAMIERLKTDQQPFFEEITTQS